MKSDKVSQFLRRIAGYILGILYRLMAVTWRYRFFYHENLRPLDLSKREPDQSLIVTHWHGDELALIGFAMRCKMLTFASKSKDGTIMAAALELLGFTVIRGSSSRGGAAALVGMIRVLRREKYFVSFAVDGPRGPRHQAKPGAYLVAYKLNCPMIQCLVDCHRKWDIPNTWNKTYVPKPFTRIDFHLFPLPQAEKHNQEDIIAKINSRRTPPHMTST